MLFDGLEVVPVPHPLLGLGGPRHAGEPHHGPPRHAVVGDARGDAAARHGAAPAVSAGHPAALRRGHPHRHRHEPTTFSQQAPITLKNKKNIFNEK